MNIEQAFVSVVALVLGSVCAAVALFDLRWFFRLPKAQWAEARWGHRATRIGFGLIGLILILLGLYISMRVEPLVGSLTLRGCSRKIPSYLGVFSARGDFASGSRSSPQYSVSKSEHNP
jgi:hypothetical protein